MPWSLLRFQQARHLHFITFSCYRRRPRLSPQNRIVFEQALERMRLKYGFFVVGYVVMPEHVHLLMSEPERRTLATALQGIKQAVSRWVGTTDGEPFWQARYYDFNVISERKKIEKLKYMHRNPVKRGLCAGPRTGSGAAFASTQLDGWDEWRLSVAGRLEGERDGGGASSQDNNPALAKRRLERGTPIILGIEE